MDMDDTNQIYIGVNLPAKQGISNQQVVDAALSKGYDLITSRITSRTYRKRVQALYASLDADPEISPPIGEDLVVFPGSHVSNTIALCAPWAELDSKDVRIADLSYKVLEQEMAYAKFCGLPYVVIEGPKRRTHLARYAHSLAKLLRKFDELKIMVHTTFTEDFRDSQPPPELLSTWDVWDGIRVLCDYPANLGVTLEVQHSRIPEFVISRWLCEPVMMLVLGEARAFVPNPKNYPVLPKHTQSIVRRLAALKPFMLIKENLGPHKLAEFNGGDDACLIYLRNMLAKPDPRLSCASQQSRASRHVDAETSIYSQGTTPTNSNDSSSGNGSGNGCRDSKDFLDIRPASVGSNNDSSSVETFQNSLYADVLETPLQPLRDSIDSGIYDVFESDTTKYNLYYRAMTSAIAALSPINSSNTDAATTSPHSPLVNYRSSYTHTPLVIAILGAGRGALLDRVLDAVVTTRVASRRPIKIYAVEKHAGPIAYLHARQASEPTWDPVEIVHADMRHWVPEFPANIIVSELLGSFGDNELSPECLAHVERNPRVLAEDGIMIPRSYTAHVAPLFCPQLWTKARSNSDKGLETPYVVCLHQVERLAEPQVSWAFQHPATTRYTSKRSAKLTFSAKTRSRLYGFAGYFEAELFDGIKLSTVPSTLTPGLASWFPMYFPIKNPVDVMPESTIDISIWRERSQRRVWYEWAVETQFKRMRAGVSTVHNSDGHAQTMHL